MVQSDPEIMAGAPVFRGTRVPVYVIADMIEQGTPIDEILDGYPSLTREMVEYAEIYATTHPRRGGPGLAVLTNDLDCCGPLFLDVR